jgi:signal peptidase II
MLHWLWLSAAIITLDQGIKAWVTASLDVGAQVPVTPFLNWVHVHNTGAAFSLLSEASGWQRWFFAGLASVVTIILAIWLHRLRPDQRWLAASLALIIGGAIGNLIDRLAWGYVIDFIDVYYRSFHWPAFNVADSAITVGAGLFLIVSFREGPEPNQRSSDPP